MESQCSLPQKQLAATTVVPQRERDGSFLERSSLFPTKRELLLAPLTKTTPGPALKNIIIPPSFSLP